ncbi:MAG: Holliday junction resolvase RuvX [Patescibacteria group bacterium]
MRILGIDYGRKKIGLATSFEGLAEPYGVIRVENEKEALIKIAKIVRQEKIEKIVVGISEGEMGEEARKFSFSLSSSLRRRRLPSPSLPVETYDETLTTKEAQRLSIEAGIKKGKRRRLEDAFAATLVLQSFLERLK